jgi:hypothetical protein
VWSFLSYAAASTDGDPAELQEEGMDDWATQRAIEVETKHAILAMQIALDGEQAETGLRRRAHPPAHPPPRRSPQAGLSPTKVSTALLCSP